MDKRVLVVIIIVALLGIFVFGFFGMNEDNDDVPGDEERFYCDSEFPERPDVCIEIYDPVCGWFGENIKCLTYPCAETFSNSCFSCSNGDVEYYTPGVCPGVQEIREEGA